MSDNRQRSSILVSLLNLNTVGVLRARLFLATSLRIKIPILDFVNCWAVEYTLFIRNLAQCLVSDVPYFLDLKSSNCSTKSSLFSDLFLSDSSTKSSLVVP